MVTWSRSMPPAVSSSRVRQSKTVRGTSVTGSPQTVLRRLRGVSRRNTRSQGSGEARAQLSGTIRCTTRGSSTAIFHRWAAARWLTTPRGCHRYAACARVASEGTPAQYTPRSSRRSRPRQTQDSMVSTLRPMSRSWIRLTAPCWRHNSRSRSLLSVMPARLPAATDRSAHAQPMIMLGETDSGPLYRGDYEHRRACFRLIGPGCEVQHCAASGIDTDYFHGDPVGVEFSSTSDRAM